MKKIKDHISLTVFFGVLTLISFLVVLIIKYMLNETCPPTLLWFTKICMATPKYQELFKVYQFFYRFAVIFCIVFVLLLISLLPEIKKYYKDKKEE